MDEDGEDGENNHPEATTAGETYSGTKDATSHIDELVEV